MAVEFSKEQRLAIDTLDKSILVSAAAGSGKTSVLIERILSIILEGKANVDEMLVVTFTKAAASEMKLRLSKAIRKRMREHPEDVPRLRDQLARLYKAYITTIDSFALRVVREFFYETDIEPDYGTVDDIQGELMRREAASELFEAGFADDSFISGETGFREFLRLYGEERSEDGMKDDLLTAYASLRTMPDYFGWAYRSAEQLLLTKDNFRDSVLGKAIMQDTMELLDGALDAGMRIYKLLEDAGLDDLYQDKFAPEISAFAAARDRACAGGLDEELMEAISSIEFARLATKKNQKEAFEPIKEEVKALRESYKKGLEDWRSRYLAPDLETRFREMNEAYRYTVYYIRLLEEFEKIYSAKKQEHRVMDFADMEHNAVKILSNPTAAETLRKRFRFIFVDEYQDTNNIQEELIGRVSRPDNVFKVGDVKQSIYKFRQAEPEIFERLYQRYSSPSEQDGMTIDLSRNFRSNDATVRYINRVFTEVMEGYDERARLYTGCKCPAEYDFLPELHILTTDSDDAKQEESQVGAEADDETIDLTLEEAEAAYIADQAYKLIGTEFYDAKADQVRKASARDIVILYRAVKGRGEIISRALRARGIDPHIEESDSYFDTVEISVALSLLTCIDNMKRDIPLISTLHSEVFGWTPGELAEVRIAHSGRRERHEGPYIRPAFWEALQWYTVNGDDASLRDKAVYATDKIREWRRLSRMMPLEDFVWKVLTDSGYYRMAGAMNGGARRQANLRTLADRAGKYSSETVSSLSSFISFLDMMRKKNISNGQATLAGSDDDVVRITTIHKSKGLEYPFVIVGGLGHRFRYDTSQKKLSFDSDTGLSMPYVDPQRRYWRSTLMQRAITEKSRRSSYKEELRVLYVAMTRARSRLIMVGTCKSLENLKEYTFRPGNYLKVMRDVIRTPDNLFFISPVELRDPGTESKRMAGYEDRVPDALSPEESSIYDEISRRFDYRYPDEELLTAKAKYSVSSVRKKELEEEAEQESEIVTPDHEVVTLWTASEAKKKSSAADIGIAYHRIMEFLDFGRVICDDGSIDSVYIRSCAETLRDNGAIEGDVYEGLSLDRIEEFFRSDIGERACLAADAGTLRKEKPFTLRTIRSGTEMLVQGVIDCCFEEDGRMILIDYKSSFIRPGRPHEDELARIRHEYKVQIELYSEALSKGTGKETAEAYLYLFETGEALRM